MKNKGVKFIAAALMCCGMLTACPGVKNEVTGVELNYEAYTLDLNQEIQLIATPTYTGKPDLTVHWVSEDATVASVSDNGLVKSLKEGKSKITASIGEVNATCNITVEHVEDEITGIKLDKTSYTIKPNGSFKLTATVEYTGNPDKTVTWTSENSEIATVDQNGNVSGLKLGSTVISAKAGEKKAECTVKVGYDAESLVFSGPVNRKQSFVDFDSNKKEKTNKNEEYADRTQTFTVGDDNAINLMPTFSVYDDEYNPLSQSFWIFDYEIKVSVIDGETKSEADETMYEIVDAKNCDIKFRDAAIGKNFEVAVTPGGLDEADKMDPDNTAVYSLRVEDGYNVTTPVELGYFDTRVGASDDPGYFPGDGDLAGMKRVWDAFKTSKGMDVNYHPANLFIMNNLTVTPNDIPSEYIYNSGKGNGSFKDRIYLYDHFADDGVGATDVTLNGNYFKLDFTNIPLVTRSEGRDTMPDEIVSHAGIFKASVGNVTLKNMNVVGNAKKATEDGDAKYGGGLILLNADRRCETVNIDNLITKQCYISFFSEHPNEGLPAISFNINGCKATDNYNCFIYNWGGSVKVKDSLFSKCGGPILIQDHTGIEDGEPHELIDIDNRICEMYGFVPDTVFEDCALTNYVTGQEAWFIQFGATALAPQIKAMSDMYAMHGYSYIYSGEGDKKTPAVAQMTQGNTFFNFIAVNKDSSAEGITALPACGSVKFINNGVVSETYNYAQPDGSILDIYAEASRIASIGTPEEVKEFIDKYNIPHAEDYSDAVQQITDFVNPLVDGLVETVTNHTILRALNANGAPVYQSGTGFATYDGAHQYLQPLLNGATWQTAGPVFDEITNEDPFFAEAKEHTAVYYNGMMLVFGLSPLSSN